MICYTEELLVIRLIKILYKQIWKYALMLTLIIPFFSCWFKNQSYYISNKYENLIFQVKIR